MCVGILCSCGNAGEIKLRKTACVGETVSLLKTANQLKKEYGLNAKNRIIGHRIAGYRIAEYRISEYRITVYKNVYRKEKEMDPPHGISFLRAYMLCGIYVFQSPVYQHGQHRCGCCD